MNKDQQQKEREIVPMFNHIKTMSKIKQSFSETEESKLFEGGVGRKPSNRGWEFDQMDEGDFNFGEGDDNDSHLEIQGSVSNFKSASYQIYTPSSNGFQQIPQTPLHQPAIDSQDDDLSFDESEQEDRRELVVPTGKRSRASREQILLDASNKSSFDSNYFVFNNEEDAQFQESSNGIAEMMAPSMTPISRKQSSYIQDKTGGELLPASGDSRIKMTTSRNLTSSASKQTSEQSSILNKQNPHQSMVALENTKANLSPQGFIIGSAPMSPGANVTGLGRPPPSQDATTMANNPEESPARISKNLTPVLTPIEGRKQVSAEITDDDMWEAPPQEERPKHQTSMTAHDLKSVPYFEPMQAHRRGQSWNVDDKAEITDDEDWQMPSQEGYEQEQDQDGVVAQGMGIISEQDSSEESSIKKVKKKLPVTQQPQKADSMVNRTQMTDNSRVSGVPLQNTQQWNPKRLAESSQTRIAVRESLKQKLKNKPGFQIAKNFYKVDNQEEDAEVSQLAAIPVPLGLKKQRFQSQQRVGDDSQEMKQAMIKSRTPQNVKPRKVLPKIREEKQVPYSNEHTPNHKPRKSRSIFSSNDSGIYNEEMLRFQKAKRKNFYLRQNLRKVMAEAGGFQDRHQFLRDFFITNEIPIRKYHYTVDKGTPSIFDHFSSKFSLSSDGTELIIHNFKPYTVAADNKEDNHECSQQQHNLPSAISNQNIQSQSKEIEEKSESEEQSSQEDSDDNGPKIAKKKLKKKKGEDYVEYKRRKSNATCKLKDIIGFVYGGLSSRFWMLRKHVNSMNESCGQLPFYCWQCLTLQLRLRDIDFVFDSDLHMILFLEFLMFELQTADGLRNTGKPIYDAMIVEQGSKSPENKKMILNATLEQMKALRAYNQYIFVQNLLKKYKLMKVRMKISYSAFMQSYTIEELMLKTILQTYKQRKKEGLIENPYPNPKDNKIVLKLIAGKSTIGPCVEQKKKALVGEAQEKINSDQSDDYQSLSSSESNEEQLPTGEQEGLAKSPANRSQMPKILDSHIAQALDRNKPEDIFLQIMRKTDQQMTTDEIAHSYVHYKFRKIQIMQELNRVKMLLKLSMTEGPIYILCLLKVIAFTKALFVLELEKGIEVKIPSRLGQSHLPLSFRYYDSLIKIVQENFSNQKKDFSKLKKSISYAFDQKFSQGLKIFGQDQEEDDSKRKQKYQNQLRKKQFEKNSLNFRESAHIDQVQYSKFIKIDDDFINQADRVKREIAAQGGILNKFQREQRLFDELGEIHLKYCQAKQLAVQRKEYLKYKFQFSNQMNHLKQKGKKLQSMQMMDEKLVKALRHNIFNHDDDKLDQKIDAHPKPGILDEVQEMQEGSFLEDDTHRARGNPRRRSEGGGKQIVRDGRDQPRGAASNRQGRHFSEQSREDPHAYTSPQLTEGTKQSLWYSTNSQKHHDDGAANIGTLSLDKAAHAEILLLWQREFDEEYLPAYAGNDHLAYKKYSNALHSAANAVTEDLFQRRRTKNFKELRKLLTKNATYEKKSAFVDEKIESDIRFFSKDYTSKQRYIINIRKNIRRNQKIVAEREKEALDALQKIADLDEDQKIDGNLEDFSDTEESNMEQMQGQLIDKLGRAQQREKTNEQYFGHARQSTNMISTTVGVSAHKNKIEQSQAIDFTTVASPVLMQTDNYRDVSSDMAVNMLRTPPEENNRLLQGRSNTKTNGKPHKK